MPVTLTLAQLLVIIVILISMDDFGVIFCFGHFYVVFIAVVFVVVFCCVFILVFCCVVLF